jgi:hypothetical protein
MIRYVFAVALAFCSLRATASTDEPLPTEAKWMIEKEGAWANMACGGKLVASEILADDFQGTSPKGSRYGKPAGERHTIQKLSGRRTVV